MQSILRFNNLQKIRRVQTFIYCSELNKKWLNIIQPTHTYTYILVYVDDKKWHLYKTRCPYFQSNFRTHLFNCVIWISNLNLSHKNDIIFKMNMISMNLYTRYNESCSFWRNALCAYAIRIGHVNSVIRQSSIGTLDTCIYVHVTYSQMHNILSKRHYRTYCKPPWHISPQIGEKLPAACPRMSCNGELDEWAHHYSQLQVDFHWPIWIWILRDYILDVMLTVCYQLSLQINDVKLILLSEQMRISQRFLRSYLHNV